MLPHLDSDLVIVTQPYNIFLDGKSLEVDIRNFNLLFYLVKAKFTVEQIKKLYSKKKFQT